MISGTQRPDDDGDPAAPPGPAPPEADRLAAVLEELERLGAWARYYAELRLDAWRLAAREAALAIVWGAVGLLVAAAALATAVALCLVGLARALNAWAGNDWAGPLATGGGLLLLVLVGLAGGTAWYRNRSRRRMIEKYERLRAAQFARHTGNTTGHAGDTPRQPPPPD
jgi:hypothetical protein